ncbi:MAG: LysR family transcriptional regulator [Nocardioides sp.]|nr:LysR family transcriptional regulator [Nocardioides sp.]
MDLLEACRVFVNVADLGSFTPGASAAPTSQSAASRRIAAREAELGGVLFDRSARRAMLTSFGRQVLPTVRRVVDVAESLADEAAAHRSQSVHLALPEGYDVHDLAGLELTGRDRGLELVLLAGKPDARARLVASDQVHAALLSRPVDEATWTVDLGLASAVQADVTHLDQLRPGRLDGRDERDERDERRTVRLLPEDDVPHVRDVAVRGAESVGPLPSQLRGSSAPGAALAAVLGSRDLVLTSRPEGGGMELQWQPLRRPSLRRGYALVTAAGGDVHALASFLDEALPAGPSSRCPPARPRTAGP